MKLIDRYLLKNFLVPLGYCLTAFILIYMVFDLFDNLSNFIKAGTPLPSVLKFYALLIPSVLVFIVPISLLLSALYSLSQLTKNNELTAMRASGISLYRLVTPFIGVGIAASLLVAVVNEVLAPWSAYWSYQFIESLDSQNEVNIYKARNLAYKNESYRRIWLIGTFDTRTFTMENVEMIQQREDDSDDYKIQAPKAQWLDGRWWLSNPVIQRYDKRGHPMGPPKVETNLELTECSETPEDFLNEIKDPAYLSSRAIIEYLRTHQQLSDSTIARIKVDLHYRQAMPWTCLVVVLLGIPFGSQTGRKGALLGIILALSLFFSYYILINVGMVFGKKQMLEPWLSVWLPNMVFFIIGSVLVHRMR
jgi:lipopolysaccharide export system permease protein